MLNRAIASMAVIGLVCLSALPAAAITKSSARQICVKAGAAFHSELLGNVQVRSVKAMKSGYQVRLQVKGVESNCMLTKSGKVRYIN